MPLFWLTQFLLKKKVHLANECKNSKKTNVLLYNMFEINIKSYFCAT